MRASVLALAALAAGSACGRDATRLEGHWRGTFVEGVTSDQLTGAMNFAKAMELDVKGDVITVTTAGERQSGKFEVDAEDRVSITIHTDRDGPQDKQTFVFSGDKVMKWTVTEGRPAIITFVKDDFAQKEPR